MTVGRKKKGNGVLNNGASGFAAAQKDSFFLSTAKARLSSLSEVRPERVRKALERVSKGFYDRPAVVSKIADRFLEEMGID